MGCFHPLQAYRQDNGEIVFYDDNGKGRPIKLPCNNCIGCRIDKSKEWALRLMHEASLYDDNCFITLTYNAKNLPPDCGLIKSDYQLFMKRYRRYLEAPFTPLNDDLKPQTYKYNTKHHNKGDIKEGTSTVQPIHFYHVGEYGDQFNRPHYHALIFGHNFDDWVYLFDSPAGNPIYTSPTLEKLWGLGYVTIGDVTFESAAYCARYVMKKINGKLKDSIDEETGLKHYERINSFTGEISEVIPEYATMSRGGRTGRGIGHNWISTYTGDVYPKDYTTVKGRRVKPPRYYDKYLEGINPDMYDDIKASRELSMSLNFAENDASRLRQKEIVCEAKNSKLKRSL